MDSEEDEMYDDGDALEALDGALDAYAAESGHPAAAPAAAGFPAAELEMSMGGFDQLAPTLPPSEHEEERAYDFPAHQEPGENPMSLSMSRGSGGLGTTSNSIGEEIDVTTNGLIDETVQRLSFIHGVLGVLIVDKDGLIVHATMPTDEAAQLSGPVLQLLDRARAAAALAPEGDELQMLCVRTRKYEMLMCSEMAGAFAVCVLQDAQPDDAESSLGVAGKAARRVLAGGGAMAQAPAGVVF